MIFSIPIGVNIPGKNSYLFTIANFKLPKQATSMVN